MLNISTKIKEIDSDQAIDILNNISSSDHPIILRGLVNNWPVVKACKRSNKEAKTYLHSFYKNSPIQAFIGSPAIKGRFFYNNEVNDLNFETTKLSLTEFLEKTQRHKSSSEPPALYVGSTNIDACLPGLREENDLNLGDHNPLVSIWLGNQSRIAAHYDAPNNIACNIIGKRRFILFPPEQITNLYIGPIDFTPAGQSASMVDFHNPDFAKYPRFQEALTSAQIAELEPGDAIFIPSMWWHHVEGLSYFNALVNYWWRTAAPFMGQAINVLHHAMLSIRDLPEKEKQAWQHIFNHYIFGDQDQVNQHIPTHSRGILEPLDNDNARQLRALLLSRLNR